MYNGTVYEMLQLQEGSGVSGQSWGIFYAYRSEFSESTRGGNGDNDKYSFGVTCIFIRARYRADVIFAENQQHVVVRSPDWVSYFYPSSDSIPQSAGWDYMSKNERASM